MLFAKFILIEYHFVVTTMTFTTFFGKVLQ